MVQATCAPEVRTNITWTVQELEPEPVETYTRLPRFDWLRGFLVIRRELGASISQAQVAGRRDCIYVWLSYLRNYIWNHIRDVSEIGRTRQAFGVWFCLRADPEQQNHCATLTALTGSRHFSKSTGYMLGSGYTPSSRATEH
jgi:hypothetical protein